jgi:hypothetical protein
MHWVWRSWGGRQSTSRCHDREIDFIAVFAGNCFDELPKGVSLIAVATDARRGHFQSAMPLWALPREALVPGIGGSVRYDTSFCNDVHNLWGETIVRDGR